MNDLQTQIKNQWKSLRGRTYDFLDVISQANLENKLPFQQSQSIYYQFDCMIGTTETITDSIKNEHGDPWHCSLPNNVSSMPKEQIKKHLQKSDDSLLKILTKTDLLTQQADNRTPLDKYLELVEHESQHQGQIINFIYALNLPIPQSWATYWHLKK